MNNLKIVYLLSRDRPKLFHKAQILINLESGLVLIQLVIPFYYPQFFGRPPQRAI